MRWVATCLVFLLIVVGSIRPVAAQENTDGPPPPEMSAPADASQTAPDATDSGASDQGDVPPVPVDQQPVPTPTAVPTPAPSPTPSALSAADIAALIRPSVVQIKTPDGEATGVKIAEGVLTNAHVVGTATQVELILNDGSHVSANVARTDPSRDLALLNTSANLPAVGLDLAAGQRQGDAVYVLGFPEGIGGSPTLSHGLISAVRLNDHGLDLVQSDAPVSPGSSGSPIIDTNGKMIALHSFSENSSVHFAIATETIRQFLTGAPAVGASPLATDAALGAAPSPSPFGGQPEDITVKASDLGSGWTQSEQQRDPPTVFDTGVLRTVFRNGSGGVVRATTIVFRTRDLALKAWSSTAGGSLETCEASVYGPIGDGAVEGACLVQNVAIELKGASYDVTRAAVGAASKRVSAAVPVQPPASSAANGPLFKASPTVLALSPGDLGSGWSVAEQRQDQANPYSSGRLWSSYRQGSSTSIPSVSTQIEVFRDVETAKAAFSQSQAYVDPSPLQVCDAGATWAAFDGGTAVDCRRANVTVRVFAANLGAARALLDIITARIDKGLS